MDGRARDPFVCACSRPTQDKLTVNAHRSDDLVRIEVISDGRIATLEQAKQFCCVLGRVRLASLVHEGRDGPSRVLASSAM